MNDELNSIGGFKTEHRGLIDVKVCLPAFFLHLKDVNGLKNHITCRNLSMTDIDISVMTLKMKVFFYPFSCRVIDETHLNAYRAIDLGVFQTFTCYFIDLLALFCDSSITLAPFTIEMNKQNSNAMIYFCLAKPFHYLVTVKNFFEFALEAITFKWINIAKEINTKWKI